MPLTFDPRSFRSRVNPGQIHCLNSPFFAHALCADPKCSVTNSKASLVSHCMTVGAHNITTLGANAIPYKCAIVLCVVPVQRVNRKSHRGQM